MKKSLFGKKIKFWASLDPISDTERLGAGLANLLCRWDDVTHDALYKNYIIIMNICKITELDSIQLRSRVKTPIPSEPLILFVLPFCRSFVRLSTNQTKDAVSTVSIYPNVVQVLSAAAVASIITLPRFSVAHLSTN